MPEDDKAKKEKLAAARKKVEQMKKQKAKQAAAKKDTSSEAKADAPETSSGVADEPPAVEDKATTEAVEEPEPEQTPTSPSAAPSLSQQSKTRSKSFRAGSISASGPLSPSLTIPEGDTAPEIYRKQVARIEELEKEVKRLVAAETRWRKMEEELADLREAEGKASGDSEVEKLKNELAALQRQNSQLHAQVSRSSATRHGSSPSVSMSSPPSSVLEAQLQSKSNTIETMELEMSRLRAQVERLSVSTSGAGDSEQISALEEKLARSEKAAALAQRELADLKGNLERTTAKAVKESSERVSAETKLRTLEREREEVGAARDELQKKADGLEKKVATLTTLHKEQDARMQTLRKEKEKADKELTELRSEVAKLRKIDAHDRGGTDDDHLDELENEERVRLEKKVRELESENHDLRRGIWHERRKEMQVGPDDASPSGQFTDVDLGGGLISPSLKKGAGGITDFFTSGLNALAGGGPSHGGEHEGFLEDDDMEFDEAAFRKAQEEDAKKRIERIKEIKRSLKNWENYRLDLVESRHGSSEGFGEIFEV